MRLIVKTTYDYQMFDFFYGRGKHLVENFEKLGASLDFKEPQAEWLPQGAVGLGLASLMIFVLSSLWLA